MWMLSELRFILSPTRNARSAIFQVRWNTYRKVVTSEVWDSQGSCKYFQAATCWEEVLYIFFGSQHNCTSSWSNEGHLSCCIHILGLGFWRNNVPVLLDMLCLHASLPYSRTRPVSIACMCWAYNNIFSDTSRRWEALAQSWFPSLQTLADNGSRYACSLLSWSE